MTCRNICYYAVFILAIFVFYHVYAYWYIYGGERTIRFVIPDGFRGVIYVVSSDTWTPLSGAIYVSPESGIYTLNVPDDGIVIIHSSQMFHRMHTLEAKTNSGLVLPVRRYGVDTGEPDPIAFCTLGGFVDHKGIKYQANIVYSRDTPANHDDLPIGDEYFELADKNLNYRLAKDGIQIDSVRHDSD